ncbi:MAG: hypothetical protein H6747_12640 [Deltaproteobacteria bacterium]|nr:hypothetical protein [Deltaproteobacteria bacterium]
MSAEVGDQGVELLLTLRSGSTIVVAVFQRLSPRAAVVQVGRGGEHTRSEGVLYFAGTAMVAAATFFLGPCGATPHRAIGEQPVTRQR